VHQQQASQWGLRRLALFTADALSLFFGLVLACAARYDGNLGRADPRAVVAGTAAMLLVYSAIAYVLRLHLGRFVVGSVDEIKGLAVAIGGASFVVLVANLLRTPPPLPRSVPLLGATVSFLLMLGIRLVIRTHREGAFRPRNGAPTLVFGAGDAGDQLIHSMLSDPTSPYLPVGILDDDHHKRHVRLRGVRMRGGRDQIAQAIAATGAEVVVIALPSADSSLVRDVSQRAVAAGATVRVLPGLAELLGKRVGIRDVRDINIADLLGRRQIDTNVEAIANYLRGRRVLVTGAGGSIGSELCRQVINYGPEELIMLDRDESALHALQLSIHGAASLDLPEVVLADIRDSETLQRVFTRRRPEVVFHAAALKHVNMLEQYPDEGWKTNVLGTRNVLDAAVFTGVSHFINVSTDKAADPVNVLGKTKRMAELLTATYAQRVMGQYLSVRFGNVLGSRGSVLDTFAAQIVRGGPVTITHPDVTRYFMTIPEAVQLVIQAGAIGGRGEVLVLDMGEPVRIADVAGQLIAMEGQAIDIVYTGLHPGEKLHEKLFGAGEVDRRPIHPLISHVPAPVPDESEDIRGLATLNHVVDIDQLAPSVPTVADR
jgi:FlaA1/EpsC-like NDP-sugar epimerase